MQVWASAIVRWRRLTGAVTGGGGGLLGFEHCARGLRRSCHWHLQQGLAPQVAAFSLSCPPARNWGLLSVTGGGGTVLLGVKSGLSEAKAGPWPSGGMEGAVLSGAKLGALDSGLKTGGLIS